MNTGIRQDNKNITEVDEKIHITIVKLQMKMKKTYGYIRTKKYIKIRRAKHNQK